MKRRGNDRGRGAVLLVDLGNTNLKWASWTAAALGPVRSAPHREKSASDLLDECWSALPTPERVLVANVAGPALAEALDEWASAHWHRAPEPIRSAATLLGVTNGYREPGQLGIDRLLAMAAAHRRLGAAVCVVDCGTAITIDAVAATGHHLGGLILPGFAMMRQAIEQGTAIPRTGASAALELLARDTATAVESGPVYAVAALIERVMARLGSDGSVPALVLTGSGAARLAPVLEIGFEPMEHLVIEALALLAGDSIGS